MVSASDLGVSSTSTAQTCPAYGLASMLGQMPKRSLASPQIQRISACQRGPNQVNVEVSHYT